MVIVPVGGYVLTDGGGGVSIDLSQILKGCRFSGSLVYTRVDDKPVAPADMKKDAFSVTRPENGDFDLIGSWGYHQVYQPINS
jgi:hypothetical protein